MKISITVSTRDVERMLVRMEREVGEVATKRALNRLADQAKTRMSREIRAEYDLTKSKVDEKLHTRVARRDGGSLRFTAALLSYGQGARRAINLINFQAKQAKRRGRVPGITTVRVRRGGARAVVRGPQGYGAFIGNKGRTVFQRVGPGRLPIKPVQTIDVPQMFNQRRINASVRAFIAEKFDEIFTRELRFALRQAGAA